MTKIKKIVAIVSAAVMVTSTMAVGTGVSAFAEGVEPTAVVKPDSPNYAYSKTISFVARSFDPYYGDGYNNSTTVTNSPARIGYYSCSVGAAKLTIYVNNSVYGTYLIPASPGTTIYHNINCSAGDKITFMVVPDSSYQNCEYTVGNFTLYYSSFFEYANR